MHQPLSYTSKLIPLYIQYLNQQAQVQILVHMHVKYAKINDDRYKIDTFLKYKRTLDKVWENIIFRALLNNDL